MLKIEDECNSQYPITGSCLDCDWQDDILNAETDYCGDYDEFVNKLKEWIVEFLKD